MTLSWSKDLKIREAKDADLTAIADLHAESWRTAYRGILTAKYLDGPIARERLAFWQGRMQGPASKRMCVLLAEAGEQLAGFACAFSDEDPVFGSLLDNLHVAPPLTGQGLGRRLLSEVARWVIANSSKRGLYFWVFEQNHRARRFYARAGAVPVDSAENDMPDGQRIFSIRYHWPDACVLV